MKFIKDIKDYLHDDFDAYVSTYAYNEETERKGKYYSFEDAIDVPWNDQIKNGMIPEKGDILDIEDYPLPGLPVTDVIYTYRDGKLIEIYIKCKAPFRQPKWPVG